MILREVIPRVHVRTDDLDQRDTEHLNAAADALKKLYNSEGSIPGYLAIGLIPVLLSTAAVCVITNPTHPAIIAFMFVIPAMMFSIGYMMFAPDIIQGRRNKLIETITHINERCPRAQDMLDAARTEYPFIAKQTQKTGINVLN